MINLTDSVPVGLYFMEHSAEIKAGDIVAFLPPGSVADLLHSRNYVSDGMHLIKYVAGVEGDSCCVDANREFRINGKLIGFARDADGENRPLPHLLGCFKIKSDNFVLAGNGSSSFDSRYFGSVSRKELIAKLKPILTTNQKDFDGSMIWFSHGIWEGRPGG